jgi:hypothetical protein
MSRSSSSSFLAECVPNPELNVALETLFMSIHVPAESGERAHLQRIAYFTNGIVFRKLRMRLRDLETCGLAKEGLVENPGSLHDRHSRGTKRLLPQRTLLHAPSPQPG